MNETSGMTIVEFLEARIAEDEAAAKAASESSPPDARGETVGPEWDAEYGMVVGQRSRDGYHIGLWDDEGSGTLQMDPAAAYHVARHDPARALAECAANRDILDLHAPVKDDGWLSGAANDYLWCGSCGSIDDSPEPYPCGTLKATAAVYKGHPDYRQEWSA